MVMAETRPLAAPPNTTLLSAARGGDASAIEQLLLPHEPTLRAVCRGMLGRREDAEDAVQETFLKALRGLESFRGEASLKTWLVKIAVHVCAARQKKYPAESSLDESLTPLSTPSPERAIVRQALLTEALATLSPNRRVALLLKAEGWTLEEIGQAQGWSAARVKVELFRARVALEKWAQKKADEEARI
jgi:RNA polymerase sigma-70 factor, ECF subfamily